MTLKIGDRAPDFELENQRREKIRLSSFRGKQHVLVMFHPLAFTPFCSTQMADVQQTWPSFVRSDTHALGISVDSSASKAAWAQSLGGLPFDILADFHPHGAVAADYGVLRAEGFAERATFLVDKDGIIRWMQLYNIPAAPDLQGALAAIAELR